MKLEVDIPVASILKSMSEMLPIEDMLEYYPQDQIAEYIVENAQDLLTPSQITQIKGA